MLGHLVELKPELKTVHMPVARGAGAGRVGPGPCRRARRRGGAWRRRLGAGLLWAALTWGHAGGAPPAGWLDWIDGVTETAPLAPDAPVRRGWMAAAADLSGWVVPYALLIGGGDWCIASGGAPTPHGLADRPVLRLDRGAGVLILGEPTAPAPGSFGMPTLSLAARPGPGAQVWVATADAEGRGLLEWTPAEILAARDQGLHAGPRLRVRLGTPRSVFPGAVVATADGALASIERAVPATDGAGLFECVHWPPPGMRGLVPGVRLADLVRGLPPATADDAWAEGEILLASGQAEPARAALDRAWRLLPDRWPVAALAALAATAAGAERGAAVEWVERALALAPERQEVQAVAMTVAERLRDGALRRAWLEQLVAAKATGPDVTLGWALDAMGRAAWAEALDWLADPDLQRAQPGRALREAGRCLLELGRTAEAVAALQEAAARLPDDAVVHDRLCVAATRAGQGALASEAGRRAILLDPTSALAHQHLGVALAAWGKPELAAAAFEQALRLNPRDLASLTDLGKILVWAGRPEAAEPYLHRALELDPDNLLALIHLAEAAVQRKAFDAAERFARRAVERVPGDPEAWYCLAGVQRAQGQGDEARATLEEAIRRAPERRDYWAQRVRWETETRDADRVLAVVQRALDRFPDDPQLLDYQGWALLNLGRTAEAEAHYRRATVQHPRDAGLWVGVGQCVRRRGQLDEAIAELTRALDRVDQPGLVAGHLGFLLGLRSVLAGGAQSGERFPGERWEEYSAARAQRIALQAHGELAAYFEALRRDRPDDPYLELFVAQGRLDAGELAAAESILRRLAGPAAGPRPVNLMALELLADLMRRSGALEEAERIGDWLVRANPYSEMGYAVLGTALVNRGEPRAALERIAPGLKYYPESNVLGVIQATALARDERWPDALEVLDRISARQPAEADVHYLQAYCRFRMGRTEEAYRFAQVAAVVGDADRSRQARALLALIERRQAAGAPGGAAGTESRVRD